MRRAIAGLIVCFVFLCHVSAQSQRGSIESAAWLAGCWEGESSGGKVTEQWMKPAGQAMFGMGRTVLKNKVVDYEFMQIQQRDDGEIYFIARPARQQEAAFKLIKTDAKELIFENPQHDFPQRIIFRLEGEGSLMARIEGINKGKDLRVDYPMKRVKCD